MNLVVRAHTPSDLPSMTAIWNEVVEEGTAFPQLELLTETTGLEFFASQTYCGVAENPDTGEVLGLYILHPNNVGRCGHICNASYAVHTNARGQHVGEALVRHCLQKGRELGFRILQFNAVVASNTPALRLYERAGYTYIATKQIWYESTGLANFLLYEYVI